MKPTLILIFLLHYLLIPRPSMAGGSPEDFIGPKPGILHVYDHYSGGPTKVWGLAQTATGGLVTLTETMLPPELLPDSISKNTENKSSYIRRYYTRGHTVISPDKMGDHILLDLSKDHWTYKAMLYVGALAETEIQTENQEKEYEIICRVLKRNFHFIQGKNRETIHVDYSFINRNNEQKSLGSVYFVEGIGLFMGNLSDSFQCIPAPPNELKKRQESYRIN